eukprot:1158014-Pelagomonas_calceolata.AAC.1
MLQKLYKPFLVEFILNSLAGGIPTKGPWLVDPIKMENYLLLAQTYATSRAGQHNFRKGASMLKKGQIKTKS